MLGRAYCAFAAPLTFLLLSGSSLAQATPHARPSERCSPALTAFAEGQRLFVELPSPPLTRGTTSAALDDWHQLDLTSARDSAQALLGRARLGLGAGTEAGVQLRIGQHRLSASPAIEAEGISLRWAPLIATGLWCHARVGYLARLGAASRISAALGTVGIWERPQLLFSLETQIEKQTLGLSRPAWSVEAAVGRPIFASRAVATLEGRLGFYDRLGTRLDVESYSRRLAVALSTEVAPNLRVFASMAVASAKREQTSDRVSLWFLAPRVGLVWQSRLKKAS